MDEKKLAQIESLAQKVIIHMIHFTKPEFKERIGDEDSWVGSVDNVTKALLVLLQLYEEVCSGDVLVKLEAEENTILRRGFFRSLVEASETQTSVINRVLKDREIDLYNNRVASLAGQLHEALGGIARRESIMENLVQSRPSQTSVPRELERLYENLTELTSSLLKLKKPVTASIKLITSIKFKAKKKLKRMAKRRLTKP